MVRHLAIGLFAALAFATTTQAAPLNLQNAGSPDVYAHNIGISYTYTSTGLNTGHGVFTVTSPGIVDEVTLPGASSQTAVSPTGLYSLTASFDITGSGYNPTLSNLVGSLSVTGNGQTLYASTTLLAVGFNTNADFEFLFANAYVPATSGTYSTWFPKAFPIGTVIHTNDNTFMTNYLNGGFSVSRASSDTFLVPLPASSSMGAAGLVLLAAFTGRRKLRAAFCPTVG